MQKNLYRCGWRVCPAYAERCTFSDALDKKKSAVNAAPKFSKTVETEIQEALHARGLLSQLRSSSVATIFSTSLYTSHNPLGRPAPGPFLRHHNPINVLQHSANAANTRKSVYILKRLRNMDLCMSAYKLKCHAGENQKRADNPCCLMARGLSAPRLCAWRSYCHLTFPMIIPLPSHDIGDNPALQPAVRPCVQTASGLFPRKRRYFPPCLPSRMSGASQTVLIPNGRSGRRDLRRARQRQP